MDHRAIHRLRCGQACSSRRCARTLEGRFRNHRAHDEPTFVDRRAFHEVLRERNAAHITMVGDRSSVGRMFRLGTESDAEDLATGSDTNRDFPRMFHRLV
jgi:hypothetical protein